MSENAFDRAALLLGAVAVLSPAFRLSTSSNNNFVSMGNGAIMVAVLLGLLALAGGYASQPMLVVGAGAGFALAALVQLVQLPLSSNWLDGSGSTFALFLALAIGLVVTGVVGPRAPAPTRSS